VQPLKGMETRVPLLALANTTKVLDLMLMLNKQVNGAYECGYAQGRKDEREGK